MSENERVSSTEILETRSAFEVMVGAFHRALEHPIGPRPRFSRPELRAKLIREEAGETADAIDAGDMEGVIDGMCDTLYVIAGTAVEMGIDLLPFFLEVHRSNMAKKGGAVREDGKTLKPPGWTPPDIAGVFKRLYGADIKEYTRTPSWLEGENGTAMAHYCGHKITKRPAPGLDHLIEVIAVHPDGRHALGVFNPEQFNENPTKCVDSLLDTLAGVTRVAP